MRLQLYSMARRLSDLNDWERDVERMKARYFVFGMAIVAIPLFLYMYAMMIRCSPHW